MQARKSECGMWAELHSYFYLYFYCKFIIASRCPGRLLCLSVQSDCAIYAFHFFRLFRKVLSARINVIISFNWVDGNYSRLDTFSFRHGAVMRSCQLLFWNMLVRCTYVITDLCIKATVDIGLHIRHVQKMILLLYSSRTMLFVSYAIRPSTQKFRSYGNNNLVPQLNIVASYSWWRHVCMFGVKENTLGACKTGCRSDEMESIVVTSISPFFDLFFFLSPTSS